MYRFILIYFHKRKYSILGEYSVTMLQFSIDSLLLVTNYNKNILVTLRGNQLREKWGRSKFLIFSLNGRDGKFSRRSCVYGN